MSCLGWLKEKLCGRRVQNVAPANEAHPHQTRARIIEFPGPAVPDSETFGVSYRAVVDGAIVPCRFEVQALQDVNPDTRLLSPLEMFEANKEPLLAVARRLIEEGRMENGQVRIRGADISGS